MTSLVNGVQDTCSENTLSPVTSYLFLTLINSLFAGKCSLGSKDAYPKYYTQKINEGDSFDFIVVGAGSAGSVLASRLSENDKYTVLLLEAGGYPSSLSDIPTLLFSSMFTEEDWAYSTETNENHCLGFENSRCNWPRGKMLGGCSSNNAMLYIRGNKRDYDSWAEQGNKGWDYESVMKTFKKIENIQDEAVKKLGVYGTEGHLPLTKYKYAENIRNSVAEALEAVGVPEIPSENSEKPLGYFDSVQNIYRGERANAAKAFLGPAKNRDNIFVATKVHVAKVIIDKESSTARGVEVIINNKKISLFANKEVILSAGAINTPQLLMLSGIGPKEHLKKIGIDLVQDLPVGKDLQDHVTFSAYYKVDETAIEPKSEIALLDELYNYFLKRTGDLAQLRMTNFLSFINTKNNSVYPDIQIHNVIYFKKEVYLFQELSKSLGLTEKVTVDQKRDNDEAATIYFWLTLLNPKSRGKLELKNNDPFEKPLIHAGYFTDEENEDLQIVLDAVRFIQKVASTKPFQRHNPELGKYQFEACEKFEFDSDEFWKCSIRHLATTIYHPTSTARMGIDPATSVVDSTLRVHGINNLRVADASIMPSVTSGNTNAPSMMIGQKASEIILEYWNKPKDEL